MCPVILKIGSITVSGYWLFTAIGLFASYIYFTIQNKKLGKDKISILHLNNYFCLAILSVFIGGAFMGFLLNLSELSVKSLSHLIKTFFEERVFYGGAVMLAATFMLYTKLNKLKGDVITQIFLPGVPLFMFFSRIGCFMGGCCYGKECSFGVIFSDGSLAPADIPLFPSQLAEATGHLIAFFVLLLIKDRLQNKYNLILIYAIYYAVLRFVLEFFRGDTGRGFFWIFSTSQWFSIALLLMAVIYIISKKRCFKC